MPKQGRNVTLEDQIVASLRDRGLVRAGESRWRQTSMAAAGALLGVIGVIAVQAADIGHGGAPPGHTYMFALYTTPAYRPELPGSPARSEEYGRWAAAASDGPAVVSGGEELGDSPVTLGPEPEGAGSLAGFFLVKAKSRDDALTLARTNPHLRYGGTVVVHETVG